jgi:hypothetical protein
MCMYKCMIICMKHTIYTYISDHVNIRVRLQYFCGAYIFQGRRTAKQQMWRRDTQSERGYWWTSYITVPGPTFSPLPFFPLCLQPTLAFLFLSLSDIFLSLSLLPSSFSLPSSYPLLLCKLERSGQARPGSCS